jgi:elongator complex protein 4
MSSFKKRIAKNTPEPPSGTRVSSYNGAVLLSTGVASVDDILGGGSPLGSILLVEEDRDTSYAKLLLKYWIAQGLCCPGQRVVVVSNGLDQPPEDIVSKLPFSEDAAATQQPASSISTSTSTGDAGTDDEDETLAAGARESMKIAFRYESMKKFETSVGKRSTTQGSEAVYCSTYDLSKSLALTEDHRSRLHCIDATVLDSSLEGVLEAIKTSISAR